MNETEKMKKIFQEVFAVGEDALNEGFTSDQVENWDSVTQMALVAAIEDAFDIMLDIDDIYELDSFEKSLEILKKYAGQEP